MSPKEIVTELREQADFIEFLNGNYEDRLATLRRSRELASTDYQRGILDGQMLAITIDLDECPEDHAGHMCLCALCRSYA